MCVCVCVGEGGERKTLLPINFRKGRYVVLFFSHQISYVKLLLLYIFVVS